MMNFITVPAVFGIVVWGIYKLFELFVCKRERIMLIEKMERLQEMPQQLKYNTCLPLSFSALKVGCLLTGMGLGLLIGYLICRITLWECMEAGKLHRVITEIYGGCVLFLGGVGLIVAFVVELKITKRGKKMAESAGQADNL